MVRSETPGHLEQVVLLALAGFSDETRTRDVYEALVEATGHDASVAAIHITLSRLEEKGWAASRTDEPAPGVGGRPRRWYRLTAEGAGVLAGLRRQMDRLWKDAASHPLLGG